MDLTNYDKYPTRLMWCSRCNQYQQAEGHLPTCNKCGKFLIKILYNPITNERITGSNYKPLEFKQKEINPFNKE